MRKVRTYSFLTIIACFIVCKTFAQTDVDSTYKPFVIREIIIKGNKKTKPYIIERELPFRRGDSVNLTQLVRQFERAKQLLVNTALFHEVIISLQKFEGYQVYVSIDVKERWYIFPIPYFKPVDRNLSEWAKQGYGIDRVNYGFKLNYNNFTGRNDKLKVWLITGYTRRIQFQYELPYVDKALKYGGKFNFEYAHTKEVNFATQNDQQVFYKDTLQDRVLSRNYNVGFEFTFRPYIKTKNTLRIGYGHLKVDTAILNRNPDYLDKTSVSFPELSYKVEYFDVDYIPYPQQGTMGELSLSKKGFNRHMNVWQLFARGSQNLYVGNKTSFGMQGTGVLRLPLDQPFLNQRMLGYGDLYLRGLEKFVVDGVGALLFKNTLKRQILAFNIPAPSTKRLSNIPFRIFIKTYFDFGYVTNKNKKDNYLVNRMLYSGGAGADLVTIYDLVLRFEYSFNQMGQSGFFFHIKNDF